jgi:hypothetical protein
MKVADILIRSIFYPMCQLLDDELPLRKSFKYNLSSMQSRVLTRSRCMNYADNAINLNIKIRYEVSFWHDINYIEFTLLCLE